MSANAAGLDRRLRSAESAGLGRDFFQRDSALFSHRSSVKTGLSANTPIPREKHSHTTLCYWTFRVTTDTMSGWISSRHLFQLV